APARSASARTQPPPPPTAPSPTWRTAWHERSHDARLAAGGDAASPVFDYHALAPELILTATIVIVLVSDFFFGERERFQTSRIAPIGVLASLGPILPLAADGTTRTMFGGA